MVPEEEAPQGEDLDGSAMVKDEESFCSDAGVSLLESLQMIGEKDKETKPISAGLYNIRVWEKSCDFQKRKYAKLGKIR